MEIRYQLSDSVVYRRISPTELLLVEIESGRIYYFTPETEGFLDFFRRPASVARCLDACGGTAVREEVTALCGFLRERGILREAGAEDPRTVNRKAPLRGSPRLLREGEADLKALAVGLATTSIE